MIPLRQSTASQEVPLGYFVDSTDGNTEETALTIANTDIKLWKMGATTLASKNSGGATHISNGVYYAVLDATDTNTLGALRIFVHVSGALTVILDCLVLPANVYDSLIAGSDNLQVDTTQVGGTAQTARDLGASVLLSSGTGTGQVSLASGAVTVGTNNDKTGYALSAAGVQAIWDALTSALTTAGSIGKLLVDNVTGSISTLQTKVQRWLSLLARKDSAIATDLATELGELNANYGTGVGAYDQSTDGQEAIRDRGDAAWVTGAGGDPWSTALPGAYGAGTAGKIIGDNLDAAVSTRSSHAAADVWSVGTRTLTAFSFAVDISATAVQAIWDALTSALTTAGSIGKLLVDNVNATISSRSSHAAADVWSVGTRTLTAFAFAVDISSAAVQAVWDALTSALTTVGSIGKLLVDNIDAAISSRNATTPLDAAGVRSAVGLASANLDTQLTNMGNLDVAVSSRNATAPLDAAGTRSAVGLASANLDTQIATLATAEKLQRFASLITRGDAAVATDLATELGLINANYGTGAGGYGPTTESLEAAAGAAFDPTAEKVDIGKINGVTVNGAGVLGNEWGP